MAKCVFIVASGMSACGLPNDRKVGCSCNPIQESSNSEQEPEISASIFRDFFFFFF